jgi:1-acyl-sn-glycerol-3-phosphate acyltransferase
LARRDTAAGDRDAAAVRNLLHACERRVLDGSCRYALEADARPPASTACACGPQEILERPVQLRGSAFARGLLRLFGWRLCFDGLPSKQGVIVVYPHTSNWDFIWGILAKWGIGITMTFWAKDSLFRAPVFGRWLRWIGGLPIDRSSAKGIVGQTAEQLRQARDRGDFMWLALAPEGTRSPGEGWRSGFYHVATQAHVPVVLAFIDYERREVGIDTAWRVHGNVEADMARFAERLSRRTGRNPSNAAPIRLI